ncbi:ATP-binding protein [Halobaculum sp. CBA1158]|uniref:ATP-binding protein n=1 Tax=Halobaculum sp. CBA1158 TaxID=2904243 RepID=UPI001F291C48|nr:ATP-binding protein [Halobaculum sp. CBA1158]UIO99844.1 ATP-binding protein [Halobaculum sp. CBA1158]
MFDEGRASGPPTPDAAFGDVVGQAELKRALVAVGAHDGLSGLLVRGEKGTGKSTLARALAGALPERRVVADCPFGCPPGERARQCPDCRRRASVPVERRPAPFVTLPLGATREAVVGSLSVADALDGEASFEPGLLARANRGVLYVDEVNLLDDHLVDVLLDAAAAGVNAVERDGVSRSHPADFTLIGTMNPEEGDLRPQLRDRFDLAVEVTGLADTDDRVAVVDRALEGEAVAAGENSSADPAPASGTDAALGDPAAAVAEARDLLPSVTLPEAFVRDVVETCRDAGVDGHRGDIAAARCARTLAALAGRTRVAEGDVRTALSWALPHRLRSDPFEDPPDAEELIDDRLGDEDGPDGEPENRDGGDASGDAGDAPPDDPGDAGDSTGSGGDDGTAGEDAPGGADPDGAGRSDGSDDGAGSGPDSADSSEPADPPPGASAGDAATPPDPVDGGDGPSGGPGSAADATADGGEGSDGSDGDGGTDADADGSGDDAEAATPIVPGAARAGVGEAAAPEVEAPETDPAGGSGGGRGDAAASADGRGARVRTERADPEAGDPVDAGASVRAAARRGSDRVESRDLRRSVRAGDAETLVCFVVDASASMRGPMRAAKGVAVELLRDSYEHRDAVALVAVAGDSPDVLLPPTDDVGRAARHLKDLPTGDRTPLSAGLETAAEVCRRADPDAALAVVVTDGGANAAERPTAAVRDAAGPLRAAVDRTLVVDAGEADGVVPALLETADAERVPLAALSAERVDRAADEARRD